MSLFRHNIKKVYRQGRVGQAIKARLRPSIDLFPNKDSLGEMTAESVGHIARATRYFFHMNHDLYPNLYDGDVPGLLAHEYPVPSEQFKLLFRYPDVGHLLGLGGIDYSMDIFLYLYERRREPSA